MTRSTLLGAAAGILVAADGLSIVQSRFALLDIFLAVFVLSSLCVSVTMVGIFTMAADSVDWHEWKCGTRNEGLLSSGISLATKVGMALGTAAIAYTLALSGYQAHAVSDGARAAIRWSYYGWPIAIYALQLVVILFWPMDGLHARIRAEVAERRALPA